MQAEGMDGNLLKKQSVFCSIFGLGGSILSQKGEL